MNNSYFYENSLCIDFFGDDFDAHLNEVCEKINSFDSNKIAFIYTYEPNNLQQLEHMINAIRQNCAYNFLWMFPESLYYRDIDLLDTLGITYFLIDIDLLHLYFEINLFKASDINANWNKKASKFLFLTGKPDRINRIKLLYDFYSAGLLDKAMWSLFIDPSLKIKCKNLLPNIDNNEYEKFLKDCIGSPDNHVPLYNVADSIHVGGHPFDYKCYQETLFRVISETMIFKTPMITEKTWITIANHHPFIISGYPNMLDYLKYKNFCTFESYLLHQDYDKETNIEQKLKKIVDNTGFWLANIHKYAKDIDRDTTHNFNLLIQLAKEHYNKFEQIYKQLDTNLEIFRIIQFEPTRSNWINFYYSVKDKNWPDCYVEEHFELLPEDIKQECINVFGYKPK
jgi:hypothetical protein